MTLSDSLVPGVFGARAEPVVLLRAGGLPRTQLRVNKTAKLLRTYCAWKTSKKQ